MENTAAQTIIIKNDMSNAAGIASFIFGLISIFFMAPIFVPLSILFGIIAIAKKQTGWAVIGLICAYFGFVTSPILMAMFAVTTILSQVPVDHKKTSELSQPAPPVAQAQQQYQTPQQQYIDGIKEAHRLADYAIQECMQKRLSGKLSTHADEAKCSNGNIEAVFSSANYMYMDLQKLVNAKRLEIAEKVDSRELTEAQGELELAEFKVHVNEMAMRRDAGH